MSTFEPTKRSKKWVIVLGIFLMLPFVLLAIVFMVAVGVKERAQAKRDALIDSMKADGMVFEFDQLPSARPEGTVFFDGLPEDSAAYFLLNPTLPTIGPGEEFDKPPFTLQWRPDKPFDAATSELARQAVKEHAASIDELKRVAALPPTAIEDVIFVSRHGRPVIGPNVPNLPNLFKWRGLTNLLSLDAGAAYEAGRFNDMLDTLRATILLSNHMRDDVTLITEMIGISMTRIGWDALAPVALSGSFSDESVGRFRTAIDDTLAMNSQEIAMNGEMICLYSLFDIPIKARLSFCSSTGGPANYVGCILSGITLADEQACLSLMHAVWKMNSRIYCEQNIEEVSEMCEDNFDWTTPLSSACIPNLANSFQCIAEYRTMLHAIDIALALNRYRYDQGALPSELSALVPKHLDVIPESALTCEAIRMRMMTRKDAEVEIDMLAKEGWGPLPIFPIDGPDDDQVILIY